MASRRHACGNGMPPAHPARRGTAALAAAVLIALASCAPSGAESERIDPAAQPVYPQVQTYPQIPVVADIQYGGSSEQGLDLCLPETESEAARATILLIHGGSWQHGDKSSLNWRAVCQWFASEGFVAVSVNYRLAPAATFPAHLSDVQSALRWLREEPQLRRYNLDPARIGAFGGSAGGNLAALLGTAGTGERFSGLRVAAVAVLSAPSDLRRPIRTGQAYPRDFAEVVLQYLGCVDFSDCAAAAEASPITLVDESDPPFFVAHSVDEFIPIAQSDAFVARLRETGVDATYVTVEGTLHSIAMLDDDLRARVLAFFRATLG